MVQAFGQFNASPYHNPSAARWRGIALAALCCLLVTPAFAQIVNGSFETGYLTGWNVSGDAGGNVSVVHSAVGYSAAHGVYFALINSGSGCSYKILSQPFTVPAGATVSGLVFFKTSDYLPYNDNGYVRVNGTNLFSASIATVGSYGGTPWQSFSYTFGVAGTYTIEAGVTNTVDCGVASYIGLDGVAVSGGNVPPVANNSSVAAMEDTAVTFALSASDSNGDALTYSIVSNPSHGTATLSGNIVIYNPYPNYFGSDALTFKANDGTTDSNLATIAIGVSAVNDAPIAFAQSVTTDEDVPTTVTLSGSDVEAAPLSFAIVTPPAHGTVSGSGATVVYSPSANYNGPDAFTFRVNDGGLDSAPATVSMTVTPVNDVPAAFAQSVTTDEDVPKAVALSGSDVEGASLSFAIVTPPAHGAISGSGGSVVYTPAANYNGPDTFAFKVNDGELDSTPATVTLTVAPVNDSPVAAADSGSGNEDSLITGSVLGNDSDVDGDVLTAQLVSNVAHGSLTLNADGSFTYLGAHDYFGNDSFIYAAHDSVAASNIVTVTITVAPVNDPPVVDAGGDRSVNEGTPSLFDATWTDVDSTNVTVTWALGDGANGVDDPVSHAYDDNGSYEAVATALDDAGGYATDAATITVLNVPPAITSITTPLDPVAAGMALTAGISFTDPGVVDTHTVTVAWGDGSTSSGSVSEASGSGTATGSHTYSAAGIYTLTFTVEDKDGAAVSQAATQYVVVYDPTAGFVTGGGWFLSPAGAYRSDPTLSGKASFGFVAKYQKGSTIPTGNTEFQFHVANFTFKSTVYDWLVISGPKAQYKGSGMVNGSGSYDFMLTAIDGQANGGGGLDKFRIRIWDRNSGGLLYDNQNGADENVEPTTLLGNAGQGGGSINIQSK